MATQQHGKARAQKDTEMAAMLKRLDIERMSGRCAICYRIISIESRKSRYNHFFCK